jgi:aldose 1-epimerase
VPITTEPFGESGSSIYTIRNENGASLAVTDLGAAITSIIVPDRTGRLVDVNLGYSSFEGYRENRSAYGAVVGRIANRVRDAELEINGTAHQLEPNEGSTALHGGPHPYYHRKWAARMVPGDSNSIEFSLLSPDGDQGMPGTAKIEITYTLTPDNEVVLRYRAAADRDTYFNLTNHSYFNLDGHDAGTIYEHSLWLDCDYFTPIDSEFIPTGEIRSVSGTAMDFTESKQIGRDLGADDEQLIAGNGYDHNFVINSPGLSHPFARVESAATGIVMEVVTDLPGVQFYGGSNMGNDHGEKGVAPYTKHGALCLETQYFPDTPHHANFPSCLFKAGEVFEATTIYRFGIATDGREQTR